MEDEVFEPRFTDDEWERIERIIHKWDLIDEALSETYYCLTFKESCPEGILFKMRVSCVEATDADYKTYNSNGEEISADISYEDFAWFYWFAMVKCYYVGMERKQECLVVRNLMDGIRSKKNGVK